MQWLDAWKNMGVAIYGRNNKLLVPGREQELVPEEDPAAAADGAATKPMPEPTTQPTTKTQSSQLQDHQKNNHGLLEVLRK
jgi:hypothetical protein